MWAGEGESSSEKNTLTEDMSVEGPGLARKDVDVGWLSREVPRLPLRDSRQRALCPLLTPWPIAIMGFAKMVGFHVVVGCSFLTATDVEKLGNRRLGESQRAPRLTR